MIKGPGMVFGKTVVLGKWGKMVLEYWSAAFTRHRATAIAGGSGGQARYPLFPFSLNL
jgi:hypothetical protein